MPERSLSVMRTVPVDAARLFAVLSDPGRHSEMDGSGMVGGAVTSGRITKVGDVFRMRVHHPAAGDYETDNHVVAFEPPRRIAWAPGIVDADPAGWRWIWELDEQERSTAVTHTYDWSGVSEEGLELISFPVVGSEQMAASIERLVAAAS